MIRSARLTELSVVLRPQTSKVNGGCGNQGSDRRRNGGEGALAKRFEVWGLQLGWKEGRFVERAFRKTTGGGDIVAVSPSALGVHGSMREVSTRYRTGGWFRRGQRGGCCAASVDPDEGTVGGEVAEVRTRGSGAGGISCS